jgi:hypothetical protein
VREVLDVHVSPRRPAGFLVRVVLDTGAVDLPCADHEEVLDHLLDRRVPLDLVYRALDTLEPGNQPETVPDPRPRRGRHRALRRAPRPAPLT